MITLYINIIPSPDMDVIGCIILLTLFNLHNCKKIEPKPVSEIDLYKLSGRFYNVGLLF